MSAARGSHGEGACRRPIGRRAPDRAGSTNPEKLRAALAATNIPAGQLIVPHGSLRFDATGQNELERPRRIDGHPLHNLPLRAGVGPVLFVLFPTPTWVNKAKT